MQTALDGAGLARRDGPAGPTWWLRDEPVLPGDWLYLQLANGRWRGGAFVVERGRPALRVPRAQPRRFRSRQDLWSGRWRVYDDLRRRYAPLPVDEEAGAGQAGFDSRPEAELAADLLEAAHRDGPTDLVLLHPGARLARLPLRVERPLPPPRAA